MLTAKRVYLGALLALIVATAGGAFSNGLFFIAQPYQLNYGEGLVAWQAAHVTDLAHAYAPLDHYPFVVFQYPPLFHVATRAMGTITSNLLVAARSVSVLSAALLCVLIGWTTFQALPRRADGPTRALAAVFAGALPTTLYNFNWTWLARVDTLAILLSFSGVALFAARYSSPLVQTLAAVLMTAALFTRQTTFAAPLACVLVAWWIDRRIALRMLLTMGILGSVVLGWLAWRTNGQVLLHLIRYNQTAFSIAAALLGVVRNGRWVAGPLVLAAGASTAVLYRAWSLARRRRWKLLRENLRANRYRRTVLILSMYSGCAALGTLANGKEGSDVNYFLEWNVSLAPLAGILLFRLLAASGNIVRLRPVQLAALAVPFLIVNAAVPTAGMGWLRVFDGPLPADREKIEVYRRMLATLSETPGPVFSEDMNLLYKTGREIPAEPAMIQCLVKAGLWDEGPFVRMIQEHRFALVVAMLNRETDASFSLERYSPAVASAIEQAYEPAAVIADYRIYRPRSSFAAQRP
ncbi:MAG: hypothetical protein JWO19_3688 [Bryobacterales bacterium]|nr:hypothetical protein [Bryobacterales bacterium]